MERVRTLSSVVAALALVALVVLHFIGESYEYRLDSWNDYEIASRLDKAGREGWSIASCRRALADGSGIYECIMQKRR